MPKYRVELTDGRVFEVEADRPPTEADVTAFLARQTPQPAAETSAPPAGAAEPESGGWSDYLPAALATGASIATGKVPVLSPVAAGIAGAAGEGMRRVWRLAQDPVPEGPGLPALRRVAGEAAEIPGAMLREGVTQGAIDAAGGVVTKGTQSLGTAVYRGYLKPSLSMVDLPKAREIVATGIREWLPVTKAGEDRAKRLIGELNDQVAAVLGTAKGGSVNLVDIANRVRAFAQRKYYRPGAPNVDYEAALKVADEIDRHASLNIPPGARPSRIDVTPAQAQETKRALDTAIGDTGFGVERGAATEARKQGRRAAREFIEQAAPEVKDLNARESKLIDALDAISHAAGREENRSMVFGVPTLLAGAYGAQQMGSGEGPFEAATKALVLRGLISPAVASRGAILAAKFAQVPGTGAAMALRMGVILAQREESATNESRE